MWLQAEVWLQAEEVWLSFEMSQRAHVASKNLNDFELSPMFGRSQIAEILRAHQVPVVSHPDEYQEHCPPRMKKGKKDWVLPETCQADQPPSISVPPCEPVPIVSHHHWEATPHLPLHP